MRITRSEKIEGVLEDLLGYFDTVGTPTVATKNGEAEISSELEEIVLEAEALLNGDEWPEWRYDDAD